MSTPIRVQLSRRKGWRMPPNTVSVARPTLFGNKFRVGQLGIPDQAVAVRRHRAVTRWPQKKLRQDHRFFMLTRESIRFHLRGKNLACWCRIGTPCHVDVLLEIANR